MIALGLRTRGTRFYLLGLIAAFVFTLKIPVAHAYPFLYWQPAQHISFPDTPVGNSSSITWLFSLVEETPSTESLQNATLQILSVPTDFNVTTPQLIASDPLGTTEWSMDITFKPTTLESFSDALIFSLVQYDVYTVGSSSPSTTGDYIGTYVTAQSIPATTPIPTTLPLFATGLGALGLLSWRRKRKAQAVAA
jgi:hypothetical protein